MNINLRRVFSIWVKVWLTIYVAWVLVGTIGLTITGGSKTEALDVVAIFAYAVISLAWYGVPLFVVMSALLFGCLALIKGVQRARSHTQ